ncbi:biotin/lipoyl-containing protein, partial [Streptomyces sp. BE303]|uniref:biotin/lipoyl-containing protein n=1 Tax=Streptomyces sp. BE303 TaxID=3002528 RepID=UPI002E759FD5
EAAPAPAAPVAAAAPAAQAAPAPVAEAAAAAPAPAAAPAAAAAAATPAQRPAQADAGAAASGTRSESAEGATVAVVEPLLEVSTDKVDTEIPSPIAGTLVKSLVGED